MATRLRDVRRRLREKLQRSAARVSVDDPGLQEIAAWHAWFVGAHTQRLTDLHLPQAEYAAQLAVVTAQAAAMVEKMREQYLANARRQS